MLLVQIYLIGVVILVTAILLNAVATKLRIMTWYGFVKKPTSARPLDYLWLFLLYPGLLGAAVYGILIILNIL